MRILYCSKIWVEHQFLEKSETDSEEKTNKIITKYRKKTPSSKSENNQVGNKHALWKKLVLLELTPAHILLTMCYNHL